MDVEGEAAVEAAAADVGEGFEGFPEGGGFAWFGIWGEGEGAGEGVEVVEEARVGGGALAGDGLGDH